MFALEYANYYKETPQYSTVAIFATRDLAEQYLQSRGYLQGEKFIPHPRLKNAAFDRHNRFWFSDDGVVSSWRLKKIAFHSSQKSFPPSKTITVCGQTETTYEWMNGFTVKTINQKSTD